MTEASVSVESRAAGGGDLCSSSFGVRIGRMDGRNVVRSRQIGRRMKTQRTPGKVKALFIRRLRKISN